MFETLYSASLTTVGKTIDKVLTVPWTADYDAILGVAVNLFSWYSPSSLCHCKMKAEPKVLPFLVFRYSL